MTPAGRGSRIGATDPTRRTADMQATSAPIQVLGVEFEGDARFDGTIAAELERLERDGIVRVLGLLFVHKDAGTGAIEALNLQADAQGEVTDVLEGGEHASVL